MAGASITVDIGKTYQSSVTTVSIDNRQYALLFMTFVTSCAGFTAASAISTERRPLYFSNALATYIIFFTLLVKCLLRQLSVDIHEALTWFSNFANISLIF